MKRHLLGIVAMVSSSPALTLAQSVPDGPATAPTVVAEPIRFERETLPNGLRVIYAPMNNAPVIHVRVLYHVGSRDEAADRNGFAHMFEHMMFRGSEHVKSEQHMKLIQGVGGNSNAFTSFDQTTYVNTIPSNHLEMALWLEADRMASFKVSDEVFKTERNVVAEEWRLRYANQPFGFMNTDLFKLAFTTHNYKWLPIGDMDQLAAAQAQELQDFHDRYYVPNNACLIIAGMYDVSQAREWVRKYYGWIPKGADIRRVTQPEPAQTEPREKIVERPNLPFTRITMMYKSPAYRNDDHLAIELLTTILGGGRSSRMYQSLVSNDPVAASVQMGNYQLEDPSAIIVGIGVLPGKDPAEAISRVKAEIRRLVESGVSADELAKAKTQTRVDLVRTRTTAESVATILGDEEVFGGDAGRANTYFDRLEKLTAEDLKRVAATYLDERGITTIQYRPGSAQAETPERTRTSATDNAAGAVVASYQAQPAAAADGKDERGVPAARTPTGETSAATQPASATPKRKIEFPSDYPTTPPMNDQALSATFEKGTVETVNGVQVITMTDRRLPTVSATLVLRGGSHVVPPEKEGVASLAASMLTRGAAGMNARQIAEEMESRGVSVGATDDGDVTRLSASSLTDQFGFALDMLKKVMRQPEFPEDEFTKLKRQALQGLMGQLSDPGSVADRELDGIVHGKQSPLGKHVTPESLQGLSVADVKAYYQQMYKPENAILVFAGAIDQKDALAAARTLLEGWETGTPPAAQYPAATSDRRQILVVDNPQGEQAVVRMGTRGYTLKDDERFAGSIAGQVLSSGIDSRLNRVLRAEKGLTYGAYGYFRPQRHGGAFEMSIETKPANVDDAVTSAFGVLDKMKQQNIEPAELAEAKRRTAGMMVLETQTIQQQAGRRVDTILNGYPVDYYDTYARRIAEVSGDEVRAVMNKYLDDAKMHIVVVGPADKVKPQLEKLGEVTVIKMPLADAKRPGARGPGTAPAATPE